MRLIVVLFRALHPRALHGIVLLFCTATLSVSAETPHIGASAGKVEHIEAPANAESVELRNGAATTHAIVGDRIYIGDHIITADDQSVSITLNDESEVVIGPKSDFTVKEIGDGSTGPTTLQLAYGLVHAIVKKVYTVERSFLVETPASLMGVRGTEFVVEYDQAATETTVHTLEGSVAIGKTVAELRSPGGFSLVAAGNMTSMKRGMGRPNPPRVFQQRALFEQLSRRSPRFMSQVNRRQTIRQQRVKQNKPDAQYLKQLHQQKQQMRKVQIQQQRQQRQQQRQQKQNQKAKPKPKRKPPNGK